ncbi:hypothetical protein KUCAC02_004889 [Chaenocephalus aceratus]|uniref:Uncharacterized protein n=1 Tax=Chaenocephalus aceratus TaxID=36190 RepID=A0ACB9X0I1_CHAAC|nr:hypothetical protein KUCAC02_004889 [Chaenocephalus aceratus]
MSNRKLTIEKDFKKYYGELRGATLFLYKDDTQDTYTEKLHLGQLKSMQLHSPYQKKTPTIFTLTLQTEEVQLQMDNSDTGEEWRGYILTVVKKEIPNVAAAGCSGSGEAKKSHHAAARTPPPPTLPLHTLPLPIPPASASPSSTPPKDKTDNSPEIPACFFHVSRKEAEDMLKVNPECGSIILRPSTLANNYALTLRQQTSSGPILKNFRVTSTNVGFVIELDTAVTVSSLNEVLNYFP